MVGKMSNDLSPDFMKVSEEQLYDNDLRLSDVGLSDENPEYEKPSFLKSIRRLPRRLKPWRNQEMWGGNLASHLWFRATVIVERVAKRIAMLRCPSLF
jgi:hypothetical protein